MESVWDYPRPPRLEPCLRRARVELGGVTVADSERALRVLETSQAPGIYFPPEDVSCLERAGGSSLCEWKGRAVYFDVVAGDRRAEGRGLGLSRPAYRATRSCATTWPSTRSRWTPAWLDDEQVEANAGSFYGGWITSDIQGPFKGAPGTLHW